MLGRLGAGGGNGAAQRADNLRLDASDLGKQRGQLSIFYLVGRFGVEVLAIAGNLDDVVEGMRCLGFCAH
jgi:hypothetical protein